MTNKLNLRASSTGIGRLPILLFSLWCTVAATHEVPHEHHNTPNIATEVTTEPADRTVRNLVVAFRQSGEDRHLDHAWSMLEPALIHGNDNPDLLVSAAMVAQSRHHFDMALSLVDRALAIVDNHDQAWLLGAAIHLVQGNADDAEHYCRQLRYVPLLVAMTCSARVSIARNQQQEALDRLAALLHSPAADSLSADWLAWSLSVAGDAAAHLDPLRAVSFYSQSLELTESTQVRAALVDVLLADNRTDDADHVLDDGADALPLDIRRMIVAKRLGRNQEAARVRAADHEFRHWIADEDWLHAREMARFYLDVLEQPALARRLAKINLEMQREPEDLLLASRAGAT